MSLAPVTGTFLTFGAFWGSWTVAASDLRHDLRLSPAGFGALLSVGLAGAALAQAVGGSLAERLGTNTVLSRALGVWAAALLVGAVAPPPWGLGVAAVVVVTLGGVVDVAMNVAASSHFASTPGGLVRFHGLFNVGAAVGALGCGAVLGAGAGYRWTWPAIGTMALVMAIVTARVALPAGEAAQHHTPLLNSLRSLRSEHLVLLATAMAVGAMVEGGVDTWGVLYLREDLDVGVALGSAGAAVGYTIGALARGLLGGRVGERGASTGITIGAGSAAVGMAVMALSQAPMVAAAGFVVAAGGISMSWPLFLSQAAARRERPGPVIGGMSSVAYLGLVAGPSIVGGMASMVGLRAGLGVLAVAALFVALAPQTARASAPG